MLKQAVDRCNGLFVTQRRLSRQREAIPPDAVIHRSIPRIVAMKVVQSVSLRQWYRVSLAKCRIQGTIEVGINERGS